MPNFKACIIIPNYNHAQFIGEVIETITNFDIPIIMVNDGSNEETRTALVQLESQFENLNLIHLPENQGKGAAVMAGLIQALSEGYSHALQVDADGQHNLKDIREFLRKSQKYPDAVICGTPLYDRSVPLGRLIPRYITHFWVWIETLSFTIKDSMCGFRVYPLKESVSVINNEQVGKRMDFDTEILVRLFWRQVPVISMPTKVIYPENGTSQFQLVKDNWLITKMHTRLFFGMVKRLPQLLKNKWRGKKQLHWSQESERGTSFGISCLVFFYRFFGLWLFKILLIPVTVYFLITGKSARNASAAYLQRVFNTQGKELKPTWRHSFKHFYQFGLSSIEKISAWMGGIQRSDLEIDGQQNFDRLLEQKQGAIFIGSHLGNIELCRALGERRGKYQLNALVFTKHALKFQKVLKKINPASSINLIQVDSMGPETAILLKQKVDAGEIIIIVGDRTSISNFGRVKDVEFLGEKAPFAEGPFILSGILECPVYLLFCIKETTNYHVYLEHFSDSLKLPRKDRQKILERHIQRYANRLEYYCLKAPYQWFNFYNFWQPDNQNIIRKEPSSSTEKTHNGY